MAHHRIGHRDPRLRGEYGWSESRGGYFVDVFFRDDDQPSTSLSAQDDDYDPHRPIERVVEFLHETGFLDLEDGRAVGEVVRNLRRSAN